MNAKQTARPTLKAVADKAGVSVVSLRAWQKAGCDVFNPSALSERIAQMRGGPGGEPMKAERLRKLRADASLAEHELAKRRGEVLDADTVQELFIGLALSCIAQFKRAPSQLPGLIEGMSASKMKTAMLDFRDEQIVAVRSQMEGVFHQLGTAAPVHSDL